MADTKIEKELHIMNGLLKDIRDELRRQNNPKCLQSYISSGETIKIQNDIAECHQKYNPTEERIKIQNDIKKNV